MKKIQVDIDNAYDDIIYHLNFLTDLEDRNGIIWERNLKLIVNTLRKCEKELNDLTLKLKSEK